MPILRRAAALLLAAALFLAARGTSALSSYPPGPTGQIGISRPTISRQFELAPGEVITGARMWLDGVAVEPHFDAAGLVSYDPPAPLAPGTHTVRLLVTVVAPDGGYFRPDITYTFTVEEGAVAVLPAPGPEGLRALEHLNRIRRAAGVPAMNYDARLALAAARHGRYLAADPEQREADPHGERPESRNFTGATPADRARYFGYPLAAAEVINFTKRAEEAIDGWMETLYHRIPLIHPGRRTMGYHVASGSESPVNVLLAGPGDAAAGTVAWPHPGQTDVPTGWPGYETPDPFRLYPGMKGPVGYTVTLTFGGHPRSLRLTRGSLSGPPGEVSTMSFDPTMDDRLTDTVAMIPRSPLQAGARYTVHMAGEVDFGQGPEPFDRVWSFTTAPAHRPAAESGSIVGRSQVVIRGSGFGAGTRVFLGGLPASDLEITSDSRLSFRAPAGLSVGKADLLLTNERGEGSLWPGFLKGTEGISSGQGQPIFKEVPLFVNGRPLALPALRHDDGTLLLPAGALSAMGATPAGEEAIGRTFWVWGSRSGDYTLGSTRATAGGREVVLGLPAQRLKGETYLDVRFVEALLPDLLRTGREKVELGLSDIGDHPARDAIVRLLQESIISGGGDGRFRPDGSLTRAAFLKMLVGATGLKLRPGDSGGFADTEAHWVAIQGVVGAAQRAGLVLPQDYPGARLEPERAVTWGEMATMMARALGGSGDVLPVDRDPGRQATRAEAAAVIVRLLDQK